MKYCRPVKKSYIVALLAEGVDRNQLDVFLNVRKLRSPSSRRAWIEIPTRRRPPRWPAVALLAEGVDRNYLRKSRSDLEAVALLAEGVDRNVVMMVGFISSYVALLAEGVDRNGSRPKSTLKQPQSPSSRRAWIEMTR